MKQIIFTVIAGFMLCGGYLQAQMINRTVRGTLKDEDGKSPLIDANVSIARSDPVKGITTGMDGGFRFENVPVGRIDLEIRYIGYEDRYALIILVNSGKEVILELEMRESVRKMEEVIITASQKKGEVLNEMAAISSRSFSVEETKRYAGSFQDPSLMFSAYAGVSSNPDGNLDIVVRGNSPKGILWRLDGIETPNPNHFANKGTTGGLWRTFGHCRSEPYAPFQQ